MAVHFHQNSHSPRVSEQTRLQGLVANPSTPVHSPHHSITSSVSSRTPLHTLTIHEYRKQQNTPVSHKGTPPGKTLRRKPAAPTLSVVERVPSVTRSPSSNLNAPLRSRPYSQSTQNLKSNQPFVNRDLSVDLPFRSHSAAPQVQSGSVSSVSTIDSQKVRYFNSRKRLPKPSPILLPPLVAPDKRLFSRPVITARVVEAPSSFTERPYIGDAQTTPTFSTLSLGQFPLPPQFTDPSFSPPQEERFHTHVKPISFHSTAPATPPATPAIIHYRGASFDLVNPHDSLLLHDIVTPSRDFDSSEFLPLGSAEESFSVFSEMAPKRALYGDYTSAHAGIMRRGDEMATESNLDDLPVPLSMADTTPGSSAYPSPTFRPDSFNAPSPLKIKKNTHDSRFSLKQLTRSLTMRKGKGSNKAQLEQELQEINGSKVSLAAMSADGQYPRPLDETYVTTPPASYYPVNQMSPITPTYPDPPEMPATTRNLSVKEVIDEENARAAAREDAEHSLGTQPDGITRPYRLSSFPYDEQPLTSMVPDDSSDLSNDNPFASPADEDGRSRPYYDDLESIYPSSSVYTGDNNRLSTYQQSLMGSRRHRDSFRYSGMSAGRLASEDHQDTMSIDHHPSLRESHGLGFQETSSDIRNNDDPKTDTISRFIDHYGSRELQRMSLPAVVEQAHDVNASVATFDTVSSSESRVNRESSGLGEFEFGLEQQENARTTKTSKAIAQDPGLPPRDAAPVAPPFEYVENRFPAPQLGQSDIFSNQSSNSYEDTRNLLGISESGAIPRTGHYEIEPSSSYSQPETQAIEPSSSYSQHEVLAEPTTPQEALDQAEQIFDDARDGNDQEQESIPAIWGRRSSVDLMHKRKSTISKDIFDSSKQPLQADFETGVAKNRCSRTDTEWETVDDGSQRGCESLDSIADYSSSEGTRNSLGINPDGSLPSWYKQQSLDALPPHLSPFSSPRNPFNSSTPVLRRTGTGVLVEHPPSPLGSSPPTFPMNPFSPIPGGFVDRTPIRAEHQPHWVEPYGLSDKETQELLASGPNEKISFAGDSEAPASPAKDLPYPGYSNTSYTVECKGPHSSSDNQAPSTSPVRKFFNATKALQKRYPIKTPARTGSSVADTSSPGAQLTSSADRRTLSSSDSNFYSVPYPACGSVTRIPRSKPPYQPSHGRNSSLMTLFPSASNMKPVEPSSPLDDQGYQFPMRGSTSFQRSRQASRVAVPGQTKLREMLLAPDSRATLSSHGTRFSQFAIGGDRPATGDTSTPLRPVFSGPSLPSPSVQKPVAHYHSPHLLCVERALTPEDEERRSKLSGWILFAFCFMPPAIWLYRVWSDQIICSLTKGHLTETTVWCKKTALVLWITINVGLTLALLITIIVLHYRGIL